MRKPLIAGNWKMNKTCYEASKFAKSLVKDFKNYTNKDVLIIPPFTALKCVSDQIHNSNIILGSQNFYPEKEGAFTGEISYTQLLELQCSYVLIGHSERRTKFHETNDFLNVKVKTAIEKGLSPILCVGETEEQKTALKTRDVLSEQIEECLKGVSSELGRYITIAYEPVWAIGTRKVAQKEEIQETHAFIRSIMFDLFDGDAAENIRILYGGSVKPDNIQGIMSGRDIDGVLVGGASLNIDSFSKIIRYEEI